MTSSLSSRASRRGKDLRELVRDVGASEPFVLSLRLTLVDLLFRPVGDWNVRPLVLLLAAAGLVLPGGHRHPGLWLVLALMTGWRVFAAWPMSDNHAYLLSYWCLAITIALLLEDSRASLARTARLLVGFVFLLAFVQKAFVSPSFGDGRFFRHTLIADSRFEELTLLVGGLTRADLERNREYLEQDLHAGAEAAPDGDRRFVEPRAFRRLAWCLTWTTLIIEGLIAAAFLWPPGGAIAPHRHRLLILFCISTYAVATVAGFGWLLVVMGLAQCPKALEQTRWAYVASYALILVYREVPWSAVLLEWQMRSVG